MCFFQQTSIKIPSPVLSLGLVSGGGGLQGDTGLLCWREASFQPWDAGSPKCAVAKGLLASFAPLRAEVMLPDPPGTPVG